MSRADLLWYRQPASTWNEALPLGNGRLGAMVYGSVPCERICLNEDSLWSGYPTYYENVGARETLKKARQLVHSQDYSVAQKELEQHFTALWSQAYLPFGDLLISLIGHERFSGYRRCLDLSTGVHEVQYKVDETQYTRECFVSAPDQTIAYRIRAGVPGSIYALVNMTPALDATVRMTDHSIIVTGYCPRYEWKYGDPQDPSGKMIYGKTDEERGIAYYAEARILAKGGRTQRESGGIQVEKADELVVLMNVRTSFNGWNHHPILNGKPYREPCREELDNAQKIEFDTLRERHIHEHQGLYGRVSLDLGGGEEADLPIDERLYRLENGNEDLALYALYFQYGRYLTIASSRKGTQASNLQGIWNKHVQPPWNSNYTLNINTEMNYWPTLMTHLPECYEPLLRLIEELSISGERTAKTYYDAPGFVSHHNTDLWRLSTPVGAHTKPANKKSSP